MTLHSDSSHHLPGLWRHLHTWPLYVLAFSLLLLKLLENTAYPCCLHFMFIHPQSSAICLVTASLLELPSQRSHKTSRLQSFFSLHLIADLSWSSSTSTSLLLSSAPTSNGKLQLDSHSRSALLSRPVLSQWRHHHPPSAPRQTLQGCLTPLSSPPHPGLPTHSARHQVLSVPSSVPSISPSGSHRTVLGQGLGTTHRLVHSPFPAVPGSKLLPLIRPPSHQISLEIRALVTPLKYLNTLQTFSIRTKLFKMTFNASC